MHIALIITTLPHFLSIIPIIRFYTNNYDYIQITILSTLFSILYHINENCRIIALIDYSLAFVWFVYDIKYGLIYNILDKILYVNLISFMINYNIKHDRNYVVNHSIWHLINAGKCFYVSTLISRGVELI